MAKKRRVMKTGTYMVAGKMLPYESSCELAFLYFAEELHKKGYISDIRRSQSYTLCGDVKNKDNKGKDQTIQRGVTYTPDYDLFFTKKAVGVVCWLLGSTDRYDRKMLICQRYDNKSYLSTIEVKPDFGSSSTAKSIQSMKWLYQVHNIFVNLFRPNDTFEKLFTPAKYLTTDTGKQRKLSFKPLKINEYESNIRSANSGAKKAPKTSRVANK